MINQNFFDTDKVATELKIPSDQYDGLKSSIRKEFPDDEMMYQLHLLRALHSASKKSPSIVTK